MIETRHDFLCYCHISDDWQALIRRRHTSPPNFDPTVWEGMGGKNYPSCKSRSWFRQVLVAKDVGDFGSYVDDLLEQQYRLVFSVKCKIAVTVSSMKLIVKDTAPPLRFSLMRFYPLQSALARGNCTKQYWEFQKWDFRIIKNTKKASDTS
jgi:hypothetical protein